MVKYITQMLQLCWLMMWMGVATAENVETELEMVVTAHPLATAAGEKILQLGGNAADAFVAIQAVLGLVEPQASGIGGGAFAVYYHAETDFTTTLDGRETAPAAATEDRFNGTSFLQAWQTGLSVGVPGVPRLLEGLHRKYGLLPWDETLFQDAIDLALDGFEVTARTENFVNLFLGFNSQFGGDCDTRSFFRDPTAFEYFVDYTNTTVCASYPAGHIQTNPEYAKTLQGLASEGSNGFYLGDVAEAIVSAVQGDLNQPGDMTLEDLGGYEVVTRDPVCIDYRGSSVCGMGPPSSGGLAVGQMLGILENFDVSEMSNDPLSVDAVHLFTQANRLAFADRNKYVADPDFVDVPSDGMFDKTYLQERASLVQPNGNDTGVMEAGVPPGANTTSGADLRAKQTGTSHVSIVDRCGNALSVTTTIESPFGNGVMVKGFLLNNELTDFSFAATDAQGNPVANRVQPKKRPRSSMAPTIIFNEGGLPETLTGSPGGASIIGYTAQSIYSIYDFGLDPSAAAKLPHYQNNNEESTSLEPPLSDLTASYDIDTLALELEARGHSISTSGRFDSGLGIILVDPEDGVLIGAADPRRDGAAGGSDVNDFVCSKLDPPSNAVGLSSIPVLVLVLLAGVANGN